MKRSTPILMLFLFLAGLPNQQGAARSTLRAPCKVGSRAAAFGFWTWAPKSEIKVYIVESDFKQSELSSLLLPFINWNAASDMTGSQVKFRFQGFTAAPLYCENCLNLIRGQVFEKTRRHATELRAYSARRDQIMTWAIIVIDPLLTNPKVLTNAIAHEIGHNFGLLDCYNCKSKSTVMVNVKTLDTPNDMVGPTDCDIAQVKAAYKQLATRVHPSPLKPQIEDEGEEPIDDDTQIVVPRPH